ncbi:putative membrane protein [Clostridium botulinum 202F]|nr:putative membrane protein [Clostridium botulinum 202F]KAI3346993.1 hypothetical protein CIT17_08465 [Clostridium botulinum]KON13669.1 membrane protein [Clostridium botulinum]MBY6987216.1 hypothetical protein [Clostridium botulinum]
MDRLLNKITSARWLIAVVMTIVFAGLAFTNRLSTEFITVYVVIINYYFYKEREKEIME